MLDDFINQVIGNILLIGMAIGAGIMGLICLVIFLVI